MSDLSHSPRGAVITRSAIIAGLFAALVLLALRPAAASASPCAGADACPWTQVETFGDVGEGEFRAPAGVGADAAGNLYVVDNDNNRVQKLDSTGAFVAAWGGYGTAEGKLFDPFDIAVDGAHGAVYVTSRGNNRIEKFDTSGNFVAAWGWGVEDGSAAYQVCTSGCQAGISGPGSGQFDNPRGIATDGSHVYVADWKNRRIQKFELDGSPAGEWAIGSSQRPQRLAAAGGWIYATTDTPAVWRFDTNGTPDDTWDTDGVTGSLGTGAGQFDYPEGLAVDATGVYVVDSFNQRIQKFDLTGAFVQMWGWGVADGSAAFQTCSASCHQGAVGRGDGQFWWPVGVAASGGSIWVADTFNHRLQQFSPAGTHMLTLNGLEAGEFYYPGDVAVEDPSGDLYVADTSNHHVQRLDPSGAPLAIWHTGEQSFPRSVTPTPGGIYVTESGRHRVDLFSSVGDLLGQFGTYGTGVGQFRQPTGSALDPAGNIYVAERITGRVQKFDPSGNPLAVFGSPGAGSGQLNAPADVAVDPAGNVYVADTGNNRVQKFDPSGNVVAGWGSAGSGDGQFTAPAGIAADSSGNIFVSDTGNHRIQRFDSAGHFLSGWGRLGAGDGELYLPQGAALDAAGALWVADAGNHRLVRFCCPAADPTTS